jgi:ribonuclease PH
MPKTSIRPSRRAPNEMRKVRLKPGAAKYAEGSCLAMFGNTHVLCAASIEERVPPWMRGGGTGWVTAEYGMLPRSTHTRTGREAARGKQSGRTQEIQRLIGRSLRAITDMEVLGERQIRLDCDVLQADGGTRTAAITGACVALHIACQGLVKAGAITKNPVRELVAAISCGLYKDTAVLDLDYPEDSNAQADSNFVLTERAQIVEIQGTAEERPFTRAQFIRLLDLARGGTEELFVHQRKALGIK